MINPKELMIGNIILDETGSEITIDTFVEVCPNCDPFIDLNKCEPIPLTEEWLVKFGFEAIKDWPVNYDHAIFKKNNVRICDYKWKVNGTYSEPYYDSKVEHVHQLQNLYFALTGEDLTIK